MLPLLLMLLGVFQRSVVSGSVRAVQESLECVRAVGCSVSCRLRPELFAGKDPRATAEREPGIPAMSIKAEVNVPQPVPRC